MIQTLDGSIDSAFFCPAGYLQHGDPPIADQHAINHMAHLLQDHRGIQWAQCYVEVLKSLPWVSRV